MTSTLSRTATELGALSTFIFSSVVDAVENKGGTREEQQKLGAERQDDVRVTRQAPLP